MSSQRRGIRVPWTEAPRGFVAALEQQFGSTVADTQDQLNGFSPGTASSVRLADGRQVFAKVVRALPNAKSIELYRQEAAALERLSGDVPVPRLLWQASGTDPDGVDWFGLVIEHVDGRHPAAPWQPSELSQVLRTLHQLGQLTAAHHVEHPPDVREHLDRLFHSWLSIAEGDAIQHWGDSWLAEMVPRLDKAQQGWRDAAAGDRLVHGDMRSDNILLTASGVVVVDWPYVAHGAGWLDLVLMLPSMIVEGGVDPEQIVRQHPLTRAVPAEHIDAILSAISGYFVRSAAAPAPPGMPTIRPFQRVQGEATLRWLRERWDD